MFNFIVGAVAGWLLGIYFRPQVELLLNRVLDWVNGKKD